MNYCTDVDLLHWEPELFREAAIASQTLLAGTGDLSGSLFTIDSGSLATSMIAQHHVIAITSGSLVGCYPIVSINSATQLSLSILHSDLYPTEGSPRPIPVGTANDVTFAIRSFGPQISLVSELIRHTAGLVPGTMDEDSVTILNPIALRRPCVLGSLQMIYNALAASSDDPTNFSVRADLYERLYRRAIRNTRVILDTNGDGEEDLVRPLNVLSFERA